MKQVIFLSILLTVIFQQNKKEEVTTLHARLENNKLVKGLYLSYFSMGTYIKDSIVLDNNQCNYSFKVKEGTTVLVEPMQHLGVPTEKVLAYIVPGDQLDLVVGEAFSAYTVTGGEVNNDFQQIVRQRKPFLDSLASMREKHNLFGQSNNMEGMKKLEASISELDKTLKESVYIAYLNDHPNSALTVYVLYKLAGNEFDPKLVEPYYNKLPVKVRKWPSVLTFGQTLNSAKRTAIGAMAPGFSMKNASGKMVSLSSFRNKFVLVDFWASWCDPCRAQSPYLVKAYHTYKDKNFTILSISLDRPDGKKDWLKAIEDDGLTWTNLSELKYMQGEVAKLYGVDVSGIPFNFLISPSGKIIAKNLRNDNLASVLAEVIGKK